MKCANSSPVTLEEYTSEDDPFRIYIQAYNGKFKQSYCLTIGELLDSIKYNSESFIMSLYESPSGSTNSQGRGFYPTDNIVAKLPFSNTFFTIGSIQRIISEHSPKIKWYAIPLDNSKPRRIGNTRGIFGIGTLHGQAPGEIIYKIFTKQELLAGVNDKMHPKDLINKLKLH